VFVADGCGFEEVVGVFFRFGLWYIFLYVFIEPDCFVEVDGFEIVEVDVIVNLYQFLFLFLAEHVEGFLFGDEGVAEEAGCGRGYMRASRLF
jgi:hypothetical protein